MLSAFWYGYVVTMPFGGLIASRFGPHRVLFAGAFMRGVIVALNPAGALLSPYALIALEAARGLVGVIIRFLLPTTREGNVFTSVCHSVHRV